MPTPSDTPPDQRYRRAYRDTLEQLVEVGPATAIDIANILEITRSVAAVLLSHLRRQGYATSASAAVTIRGRGRPRTLYTATPRAADHLLELERS